jgi:Mycothiol maleylpyruvate isomerase N-terminal domain
VITRKELADGIRFAGQRAAAAATYCKDWDHQLGHEWTSGDAFNHIASSAGGAKGLVPRLGDASLSGLRVEQIAQMNAARLAEQKERPKAEVIRAIIDGHKASADYVETVDEAELAKTIQLGGYEMPLAEIVAQIWIHHALAHAYEASARWPIT